MENRGFSEKETASLFNFGHFKNVHFLKIQKQIYFIVFSGTHCCGPIGRFDTKVHALKMRHLSISHP
jgi:hypothetical protein